MKIALVDAGLPGDGLPWSSWFSDDGRFTATGLGLVSLASLAREGDEVEIVDEKVSGPADDLEADLVGVSFKTMNAARAYELADSVRARGAPVVLGGLHASLCPDEASLHADSVVIGEGEGVWRDLLYDYAAGAGKARYQAPMPPAPIDNLPPRRMDLIAHEMYLFHSVQTARGCSLDCEFCPTRAIFGGIFRLRSLDAVVGEVNRLLEIRKKPVLFTDDVFGAGHPEFIAELTGELKKLHVRYAVICDLKMLNPRIVMALAESGCRIMCLNMPGTCTPEETRAVQMIQAAGIGVWAYHMFGFEFQDRDVFKRVVDFVGHCGIPHVSLTVLSPYPGTPMGKRLRQEGRILTRDWALYDQSHVVFKPANMTVDELEEGFQYVVEQLGDRTSVDKISESFSSGEKTGNGRRMPESLERTAALLGPTPMERLANSSVAVAGLGGVGGAILSSLARMGIGRFRIADPGSFDEPDLNRQMAATALTLGKNKAEVYAEFINSVNPGADVDVFTEGVTDGNIDEFLSGADLVIDALDLKVAPPLRLQLAARAREQGIYNISSPIIAFGTVVAIAAPDGEPMDAFLDLVARARGEGALPRRLVEFLDPAYLGIMHMRMSTGAVPSVSAAAMLVAAVVSTESTMILAGDRLPGRRKPITLPRITLVDLVGMSYRTTSIAELTAD